MRKPDWRTVTDFAKRKDWPLKLAARLGRGQGRLRWLDRLARVPKAPLKPDLKDWSTQTLAAVWIGHATLLLRVGGKTILTDPVFSTRIGLGLGIMTLGPKRLVRPALSIDELPPIDLILLSHAHFDHLDIPSLARLPKQTPVIVPADVRDLIDGLHFEKVTELRWGESTQFETLTLTAVPVRHWGARTFIDTHRGYCAYAIDTPIEGSVRRILYGADTAYQEDWKGLGPVDLAIIGIGAYDPYIAAHASPEQALSMADHVQAKYILPMHHSTFKLSHEPRSEPLERLLRAADADRIIVREVGGAWANKIFAGADPT